MGNKNKNQNDNAMTVANSGSVTAYPPERRVKRSVKVTVYVKSNITKRERSFELRKDF